MDPTHPKPTKLHFSMDAEFWTCMCVRIYVYLILDQKWRIHIPIQGNERSVTEEIIIAIHLKSKTPRDLPLAKMKSTARTSVHNVMPKKQWNELTTRELSVSSFYLDTLCILRASAGAKCEHEPLWGRRQPRSHVHHALYLHVYLGDQSEEADDARDGRLRGKRIMYIYII